MSEEAEGSESGTQETEDQEEGQSNEETKEEREEVEEQEKPDEEKTLEEFIEEHLEHTGHAGFKIRYQGKVIYIDPYDISGSDAEEADIVILTHYHFDHADSKSLDKIVGAKTVIIGPSASTISQEDIEYGLIDQKCEKYLSRLRSVSNGETLSLNGITINAVASYNKEAAEHPRGKSNGYVITIGGVKIYHAGDSDTIPEMYRLGEIDVALLPLAGPGQMTPEGAAEAVRLIKPKVVIPMHYGTSIDGMKIGSDDEGNRFMKLINDYGLKTKVIIK